ncbi:hypothetical protein BC834DRAFT_277332 [Gloeopeniophorella convolvens]|nr:hypothetical protein BC834DRAFT_277332 [Gloeopeniophorella convolvens]
MFHDQPATSTLLKPLDIFRVDPLTSADSQSSTPIVNLNSAPHTQQESAGDGQGDTHRRSEQGSIPSNFQLPAPGGASILMKDATGVCMSLDVGLDPGSGTPILSGRAITAHGDVRDVHACSCDHPISPHHKLPMLGVSQPGAQQGSPHPLSRSVASSPGDPHYRRPAPIFTSTSVMGAHALVPHTPPPAATPHQPQAQVLGTPATPLRSPLTPTPEFVRGPSQESCNSNAAFITASTRPNLSMLAPIAEPPQTIYSNSRAPELQAISEHWSHFDLGFNTPLVQSPTTMSVFSGISRPSEAGSLPTLPSPSSTEMSTRTVVPHAHTDQVFEAHFEEADAMGAISQSADAPPVGDTMGPATAMSPAPMEYALVQEEDVSSASDLYTDRIPDPPMPVARIEQDGPELRYNLFGASDPDPVLPAPASSEPGSEGRSGGIKGKWVANMRGDQLELNLNLSLDGLGARNCSIFMPRSQPEGRPVSPPLSTARPIVLQPAVEVERDHDCRCDVASNSSQSVITFGSCPSTAPPLSDLPLTPISEILYTPTKRTGTGVSFGPFERSAQPPLRTITPQEIAMSKLPGSLDSEPVLMQLKQGERDINLIQDVLCTLSHEWQGISMMPDGVALGDVENECAAVYHTLSNLAPIVALTWPPTRHLSINTNGGQRVPTTEPPLQDMNDTERKWFLKQHEFTVSLQRNLTRLALLAQRVGEDPEVAYRGSALQRISQFAAKFEDIALRLKLAHHIRTEQKYRVRMRQTAQRVVASPEQAAAHEYNKARLAQARAEIEGIRHSLASSRNAA